MNCQHLLFKFLCVFSIASSAFGGKLPTSITSQYTCCYELRKFTSGNASTSSPQGSFLVDNLCLDFNRSAYHFLSSAQGGTTSFITAPISDMTVSLLNRIRDALGIVLRLPPQPAVSFLCHFREPAHVLDVYNSIYQHRRLTRENVKIGRVQEFLLDRDTSNRILSRSILAQQAVIYTEFCDSTQILTFKEQNASGKVGNPVLTILAHGFNMSDVLENNIVVLHSMGSSLIYHVLTFRDESEAYHFCSSLRDYFNPNTLVSIPPGLQEVLDLVMSIFQT